MDRNKLFKKELVGHESSNLFTVRNNVHGYYISMKNGPYQVEGTGYFHQWGEAKAYLRENWQKIYDDIFEREVLVGSESDQANNDTEDTSAT